MGNVGICKLEQGGRRVRKLMPTPHRNYQWLQLSLSQVNVSWARGSKHLWNLNIEMTLKANSSNPGGKVPDLEIESSINEQQPRRGKANPGALCAQVPPLGWITAIWGKISFSIGQFQLNFAQFSNWTRLTLSSVLTQPDPQHESFWIPILLKQASTHKKHFPLFHLLLRKLFLLFKNAFLYFNQHHPSFLPKNVGFPLENSCQECSQTLVRAEPRHGWDNEGEARKFQSAGTVCSPWKFLSPVSGLLKSFCSIPFFFFFSRFCPFCWMDPKGKGSNSTSHAHSGLCFQVGLAGWERENGDFSTATKAWDWGFFHLKTVLIRSWVAKMPLKLS